MSTHYANVVEVKMRPHPNADSLSIMDVGADNVVVLRTEDWEEGQLAVHIEPDYEVLVRFPAFEWLAQIDDATGRPRKPWERVKPAKLRGIRSFGLLVPLSEMPPSAHDAKVGDNVLDKIPVRRWEPPTPMSYKSGNCASGPAGVVAPKYDIEGYMKYHQHFEPGEEVVATEKLHGSNARYVCVDGKIHCGSRTQWKKPDPVNPWHQALAGTPMLEQFLKENEGLIIYGEVYGLNPGYRYGTDKSHPLFAAFDVLVKYEGVLRWMEVEELEEVKKKYPDLPFVPEIYRGPYSLEKMKELAEGDTTMPGADEGDIREGIVVRPIKERTFSPGERLQLKFVNPQYLTGKGK